MLRNRAASVRMRARRAPTGSCHGARAARRTGRARRHGFARRLARRRPREQGSHSGVPFWPVAGTPGAISATILGVLLKKRKRSPDEKQKRRVYLKPEFRRELFLDGRHHAPVTGADVTRAPLPRAKKWPHRYSGFKEMEECCFLIDPSAGFFEGGIVGTSKTRPRSQARGAARTGTRTRAGRQAKSEFYVVGPAVFASPRGSWVPGARAVRWA